MTDAVESRAVIIDEYVSAAEEYMSAPRRFHNSEICQLMCRQNRILECIQGIPRPRCHTDCPLRGMRQHIGRRGRNIQPFKNALNGREILRIFLRVSGNPSADTDEREHRSGYIFL